jgi:tuftelin-interacting protein 11
MARRKRGFMDDGISDSSGGSDDENTGDDDPYQRKKRRTTGDEDSEDEGFGGRPKPAQRRDWAKAPAFVSSKTVDQSEVMDIPDVGTLPDSDSESSDDGAEEEGGQEDADLVDMDDGDNGIDDIEDNSEPSKAPSPRIREGEEEEEEEVRPRFGGLGLGASKSQHPSTFSGFTKSGIGASRPAAVSIPATPSPAPSPSPAPPASTDPTVLGSLPSAFGGSSRPQRAFVRNATPQAPPPPPPSLSASESAHFRKIEGSFGARMLAKMGWQSGTGLGAESQGIVAPIETKVRPKNMGIAFKGFTERTEQSRAEARRRGEVVSEDEEEGGKKKAPKGRENRNTSDAWKKPKKVKTKIQHKTYDQIVAEVGEDTGGPSGLGVIIDATGATVCHYSALN